MKKYLLLYSLLLLAALLPHLAFSQSAMKLWGTVSDSSRPLALVTVRLFKKINLQTPLQTTLSKDNGRFQLKKPDTGNYILVFTHSGYIEKQVAVSVTSSTDDQQIEPVQLTKASGMLNEVVVKSQRPMIEQSDDKIVFNVEDDPATKTETAIDILRKTPFITVDGDDNIKVNGKSNFKVLLNGRETSMFVRNVKEALRGFPGALISKIEVITTPSAKYDGEGIGGLINIITKKKVVGYNGTLTSFNRTSDKVSLYAINGNAKLGKLGISVYLNTGYANPVSQYNLNTTIAQAQSIFTKRTLEGNQRPSSNWNFGNAELSWEFDTLSTLSLYTNINSWGSKTISDQTITTDYVSLPSAISYYQLNNKSNNPGVNIGTDYIKHFIGNKEREFSLRFLGEFGRNDSKLSSFQDNPGIDRYLMNNSYAKNNQYTIQADNIIPLTSATRLEGGAKAILRRANSDFQSLIKYDELSDYKINPANTDYFNYQQNVISVYGMYNVRFKKSNLRAGVRVEYTDVNGDFISSKAKVKSNYTTLLPNIQFTNRVNPMTTLVFGYTKRLQRPYIWDLNPFVNNNDSLNISYGNPGLGPQTAHALTAQLRLAKGTTFAGINLEGSYSGNKILQYSTFESQTGITRTTSLNIGKEFQSSFNLNFNTKLTQAFSVFINGSLRYSTVTDNADAAQSNSGFGYNFNFNAAYKFTNKFTISTYLGLWKDPQTIQVTYPFNTWHNVAFNYKIFKNKINISLRAVNYYEATHDYKTITKGPNFNTTDISRQNRRAGVLVLTWNFGKLNENVSKKKGVTNDDLLTKPSAPTGN